MTKKNNKNEEFAHFEQLSKEWWNQNGKFRILHTLTPLRIKYIKDNINTKKINNIEYNKILRGIEILDLGCGGGLVCEPLARLGAKVTGLDFIKQNIEIAKNHAKISKLNIKYINQDLFSIKLKKKYDIILMLEVIEHIDEWKKIINKIVRYLKPKGKIIFSTINRNIFSRIFAIYLAEEILGWVPKKTHNYNQLIKPEELTVFLKKNNMSILDITGLAFNPIKGEWLLNKKMTKINYFCTAQKN